jgi:hypothetical protein
MKPMICTDMLKETFAWARKGIIGGPSEFPDIATVYATVTLHGATDHKDKLSDFVWYGNGKVLLEKKDGQEVLTGNVPARTNEFKVHEFPMCKPPSDDDIFGPPKHQVFDLFPADENLEIFLQITPTGMITVRKRLKSVPTIGVLASTFQSTCHSGLLTGVISVPDDCVCTVSFSHGIRIGW